MELVPCREDEFTTVCELYAVGFLDVGPKVNDLGVGATVLHDYGVKFVKWVNDLVRSIAYSVRKLLVRIVEINVCVWANGGRDAHALVNNADLCSYQGLVADFIFKYLNAIIAREQQSCVFIGQGQAVVCVELSGIERVFVVLNGAVVEASKVVAFEESLRCCPVGITVFDVIDEAMIVVTQFVELYRYTFTFVQNGRHKHIAVNAQLQ